MKYELKFYVQSSVSGNYYLGTLPVADKSTFDHYINLIKEGIIFSEWVENINDHIRYRSITVDRTASTGIGISNEGDTTSLYIVATDVLKVTLLTEEERANEKRIGELISKLKPEDIKRFLK